MYIYITCTYIHTYLHIYSYTHIHIFMYIYIFMCIYMPTNLHLYFLISETPNC